MARRSLEARLARLEQTLVPALYATLEDVVRRAHGMPVREGVVWAGPTVELILAAARPRLAQLAGTEGAAHEP